MYQLAFTIPRNASLTPALHPRNNRLPWFSRASRERSCQSSPTTSFLPDASFHHLLNR